MTTTDARTWAAPPQPHGVHTVWDDQGQPHHYTPASGLWDYHPTTGGGWTWEQLVGLWGPLTDQAPEASG